MMIASEYSILQSPQYTVALDSDSGLAPPRNGPWLKPTRKKVIKATVVLLLPLFNAWILDIWKVRAEGHEQRLVELQKASVSAQQKADEDRAAQFLLSQLDKNAITGRAAILKLIAELAPSHFDRALKIESIRTSMPSSRIASLRQVSQEQQVDLHFDRDLANARGYINVLPDGQVAAAFHELAKHIPGSQAVRIEGQALQSAEANFIKGDFKNASDEFQAAFSDLKTR